MPRMYYSWICRLEPRAKQGSSSVFRRYTLPLPCKQRPLSRRSQRPPQRRSSLTRACSETDVRANAFWRYKLINKTTTTVAQVKQYFLRVERSWLSCQQLDTTLGDGIPSPLRYTDTSQGLQYPYYRPLFVCFYRRATYSFHLHEIQQIANDEMKICTKTKYPFAYTYLRSISISKHTHTEKEKERETHLYVIYFIIHVRHLTAFNSAFTMLLLIRLRLPSSCPRTIRSVFDSQILVRVPTVASDYYVYQYTTVYVPVDSASWREAASQDAQ